MYPQWSTTFDAHIHRGRVMHVVVKDQTDELKSEATVQLDSLAARCRKENGKLEIWVSAAAQEVSITCGGWASAKRNTAQITIAKRQRKWGYRVPDSITCSAEMRRYQCGFLFCVSVKAGVEAAGPPADGGQILSGEKW